MARAPAMQFDVRDWLTDPELSQCSMSVKGLWMEMLCHMWLADSKGVLIGTVNELHSRCNVHGNSIVNFIKSARKHPFCDVSLNAETGVYTIVSRQIGQESHKKRRSVESSQRHRNRHARDNDDGHAAVTRDIKVTPRASARVSSSLKPSISSIETNLGTNYALSNLVLTNQAPRAREEELPAGPAGWIVTACTLTGRLLREEDRPSAHKCAKALHDLHGDTSNEMLSRICTGPPVVRFPRWLLERAVDKGAAGGVAETPAEMANRVADEAGWK